MIKNNWKAIWEKRSLNKNNLVNKTKEEIFFELKKTDGFDILNNGLTIEELLQQYKMVAQKYKKVFGNKKIESVFEVGCGCGANLYLFEQDGIKTGGIDYSKSLSNIAKIILKSKDITCDEAKKLTIVSKYDVLLSNSVFSYFYDLNYAYTVLEKMFYKANNAVFIQEIYDFDKEKNFIEYRTQNVEDYENKYKNLPKLFYPKKFFVDFAEKHNMCIEIVNSNMKNYWNYPFIFDCYMYKK
jgi:trans-aconitate methyltransferase